MAPAGTLRLPDVYLLGWATRVELTKYPECSAYDDICEMHLPRFGGRVISNFLPVSLLWMMRPFAEIDSCFRWPIRRSWRQDPDARGRSTQGLHCLIGFDSVEKARTWSYSPAFETIKPIRQNSMKSRILLIEGVAAQ